MKALTKKMAKETTAYRWGGIAGSLCGGLLILLVFDLGLPGEALAAIAYVQQNGSVTSDKGVVAVTSVDVPLTGAPAAGNTLIVTFGADRVSGTASLTCSDDKGNSYTTDVFYEYGGSPTDYPSVAICSARIANGKVPSTITLTHHPAYNRVAMVHEYSGLAAAPAVDKISSGGGNNATPSSGATATRTQADELLVGAVTISHGNPNAFHSYFPFEGGPFQIGQVGGIKVGDPRALQTQYKIVNSTGTDPYAPQLLNSHPWAAALATYKAMAAGPSIDAMIKLSTEGDGAYLTDNTYEAAASVQVKSQGVLSGDTAVFSVNFENDGPSTDSFTVTGSGSGSGFTVQYLDETAADRTAEVTGAGSTIGNLPSTESKVWTVNVTPTGGGSPVPGGTSFDVLVTIASTTDANVKDQVKATTTSTSAHLTLVKSVDKATADPGEELSYAATASNDAGLSDGSNIVLTDSIPANTGFKVDGATFNAGTSTLTHALAYSSDNGSTWSYIPVSGGCGAPAGFDHCATDVRWSMAGTMPAGTNFSLGLVVRVK